MKTVGQKLEAFNVVGVKPGFNRHEENGVSAFEPINEQSFAGKWKVIYFYPKDFTFVCPTEIVGFAKLAPDFADRDAVVLGGSTDNEFVEARLAARPQGPDEPQPLAVRRLDGLARRPARRPRRRGRRGAARHVRRRPGQRDPARVGQQPERRPQPGGDPAHPRRPADGRAVPVQPRRGRHARSSHRSRAPRARRAAPWLSTQSAHETDNSPCNSSTAIKERVPDYAKDIRLNLDAVIARSSLPARGRRRRGARRGVRREVGHAIVDAIRTHGTLDARAPAGRAHGGRADGHEQRLVPVRRDGGRPGPRRRCAPTCG